MQRHAIALRDRVGVCDVTHVVDMPLLPDNYRLEEYVDAELNSGEAISWRLEITVTETALVVDADVRRIHANVQDARATKNHGQDDDQCLA